MPEEPPPVFVVEELLLVSFFTVVVALPRPAGFGVLSQYFNVMVTEPEAKAVIVEPLTEHLEVSETSKPP